jgi:CheY-like chemotaxis protein
MPQSKEALPDSAEQAKPCILLVDDSEPVRRSLGQVLQHNGFTVIEAGSAREALHLIASRNFDVLLSDLHMPHAADGLTVVSAMHHLNPSAITLIFTGYPGMQEAANAIVRQADEILVKPLSVDRLLETIKGRITNGRTSPRVVESISNILEQETGSTIDAWLRQVELEPRMRLVQLDSAARSAHLPGLFRDLIYRLRNPLPLGTHALVSKAASEHGLLRRRQGYSAAMLVEEARMLQVTIFQTLQDNLDKVDFSPLLIGVMTIADEVDSQLAQSITSYHEAPAMEVAC